MHRRLELGIGSRICTIRKPALRSLSAYMHNGLCMCVVTGASSSRWLEIMKGASIMISLLYSNHFLLSYFQYFGQNRGCVIVNENMPPGTRRVLIACRPSSSESMSIIVILAVATLYLGPTYVSAYFSMVVLTKTRLFTNS